MQIGEQRVGEVTVLRPAGRIDNETSPAFQAKVLGAVGSAPSVVLVDLSGVEYMSSAGLRALMMAAKQSKAAKGKLGVAALTPVVKEIFAISRFSHVVQVFDTEDAALAAWK